MNGPTDWTSAIAILSAGLIIGILFVVFYSRRRSAALNVDLDRKDLEAKRDALIAGLRALPDDAVDERTRLERETADVLRRLDSRPPQAAEARATGHGQPATMSPAIKGFLWGFGSFAALAVLGYYVMKSSTPREQQPMQNAPMAQQQQQSTDPVVQQLEAAVRNDPQNMNLRTDLAQAYLERDNLMGVFEQTKLVLEKNPNNGRAMTYQALVRMAMGEGEAATQMLQRATELDPTNLDSRVALAWVFAQSGKMSEAETQIAEAIKISPADKARLEEVLQQMKSHSAGAPAQQASGELPPGHPPVDNASSEKSVRVTLDLAATAPPRGVLFVIARNPGGGPPAAVKRVAVTSFPITIDIGQADSMMGQPLPDKFRIEARLDSDGDPLTKPPTDPSAALDNVTPGAVVTLSLK